MKIRFDTAESELSEAKIPNILEFLTNRDSCQGGATEGTDREARKEERKCREARAHG